MKRLKKKCKQKAYTTEVEKLKGGVNETWSVNSTDVLIIIRIGW